MIRRFMLALAATAVLVPGTALAADPASYGYRGQRTVGAGFVQGRPRWSYYGEYQYPMPFGYGYAYEPVRRPGFEYGYYGPRYAWSAPDWYYGPAFGYAEW